MNSNKIISRFMQSGKSGTGERMFICTAISLAGTFYFFEMHYPLMDIMRMAITVAIILTWTISGLLAGKQKQWGFLAYSFLYWNIPYLYILLYNSLHTGDTHSNLLATIYRVADGIMIKPFESLATQLKMPPEFFPTIVAVLAMAMFFIGIMIHSIYEKSFGSEPVRFENKRQDNDDEDDVEAIDFYKDADFDSYEDDEDDIYMDSDE